MCCQVSILCIRTYIYVYNIKSPKNKKLTIMTKALRFHHCVISIILLIACLAVTPSLLYLGVAYTGCTDLNVNENILSLRNVRVCLFNKLYPPEPFAPYRIHDWMPKRPKQDGVSFGFNPTVSCPIVERKFQEKINSALSIWKKIDLNTIESEYKIASDTGYFRVQIINGILYGVPAKCCPGAPRHSDCCTERLGPREKYTLGQIWMVLKHFPNQIPDVDFILNTRDEPTQPNRAPIFSYSIHNNDKFLLDHQYGGNIPIPYKSDGLSIKGNNKVGFGIAMPWSKRQSKLVWRGGPTGFNFNWKQIYNNNDNNENKVIDMQEKKISPRARLCLFAGKHDDLIDFAFSSPFMTSWPTKPIPCKISSSTHPNELTLSYREQQSKFKYILDIEGFSWSSRLKEILHLDMLIFKVENDYIDFTSQLLEEGKHFISIKRDLSNLENKLNWAQTNDIEAQKIKSDSITFTSKYTNADAELCYWYTLLNEYNKRQSFQPNIHEMAYEVGDIKLEITILEFIFCILAFILTLIVYSCIIYKYFGYDQYVKKNKAIIYHQDQKQHQQQPNGLNGNNTMNGSMNHKNGGKNIMNGKTNHRSTFRDLEA